MKCEWEDCGRECPERNIGRICAYQVTNEPMDEDNYQGAVSCNCCDHCRAECHAGLLEETNLQQQNNKSE